MVRGHLDPLNQIILSFCFTEIKDLFSEISLIHYDSILQRVNCKTSLFDQVRVYICDRMTQPCRSINLFILDLCVTVLTL